LAENSNVSSRAGGIIGGNFRRAQSGAPPTHCAAFYLRTHDSPLFESPRESISLFCPLPSRLAFLVKTPSPPALVSLLLVSVFVLSLLGCAGTPKVSQWNAPRGLSDDQIFNAALRATADNGFTVVSSDRSAGLISAKKQTYAGDKMAERRMNIEVRDVGGTPSVTTNVLGSDFGIIEGTLGGAVHEEITHNFYVYLFRELGISNPSEQQVSIEDAH
jgi:hypothetical protein